MRSSSAQTSAILPEMTMRCAVGEASLDSMLDRARTTRTDERLGAFRAGLRVDALAREKSLGEDKVIADMV
ncbi:hypothetical protein ACLBKS_12510 [Hylemonella sp. W303a]|uniref:hypothetical protein n=1 Tax=Hylemonella sp. W303a TaxID=3389873 RepID=UPI00396B27FC